ncbi:MAG: glycosyltransferase family 2 protein [Candidatus Pacearchaeota archaeon]|jgi:glycosyltransferase involved in cell wall biosynthesis
MKNKTPLVSVVMPAYNTEKYIAEAIESILNQTFKDFEFIIVDDGSTDNTLQIIKDYAKKDKRIKVLRNEKNLKICKSLNKGIREAEGKYIARMDSDDSSLPTRLERQVEFMEKNPEYGVVGAFMELFDENTGKVLGIRKYSDKDEVLKEKIFFYSPFAHPVTMIRKEAFYKVSFYKEVDFPSEDLNLWFRIGEKYKFSNIQKVLLKYRYHEKSTTGSRLKAMEKRANQLRWQNWRNPAYHFGAKAFLYNFFHLISIYLIPSKFKLWLFGKWRDKRK